MVMDEGKPAPQCVVALFKVIRTMIVFCKGKKKKVGFSCVLSIAHQRSPGDGRDLNPFGMEIHDDLPLRKVGVLTSLNI